MKKVWRNDSYCLWKIRKGDPMMTYWWPSPDNSVQTNFKLFYSLLTSNRRRPQSAQRHSSPRRNNRLQRLALNSAHSPAAIDKIYTTFRLLATDRIQTSETISSTLIVDRMLLLLTEIATSFPLSIILENVILLSRRGRSCSSSVGPLLPSYSPVPSPRSARLSSSAQTRR